MNQHQQKLLRLAFQMAHVKGMEAAKACTPTPMIVGTAIGLSDKIDPNKKTYYVPQGVCGFAWVNIRPATSALAKFAKKELGWSYNSYDKAMQKWVSDFGQSMELKEAYAHAYAAELQDNLKLLAEHIPGLDKVRIGSNSRMD